MSGKGKGKLPPIGPDQVKKQGNHSSRAGLIFPVGRIGRAMKEGGYAQRIGTGSSIFLAAVLQYMTQEILEIAGNDVREEKRSRIRPRDIEVAIRNDQELAKLLAHVTISNAGSVASHGESSHVPALMGEPKMDALPKQSSQKSEEADEFD